jgi:exopolysaccharide production protein ExoZ
MMTTKCDQTKDKLLWLQASRAVAAFLVLIYHSGALLGESGQGPFYFGHAGVDLFFVISGYIIYRAHQSELGQFSALPRFLFRRLTRIYPPYWVATFFILIGAMFVPGLVKSGKLEYWAIIESFMLFPVDGQKFYPLLPVGWSLFYEMAFYTGFALLFVLPKRWGLLLLVVWACLAGWFMQLEGATKGRSVLEGFPRFFTGLPVLEFLAGVALAKLPRVSGGPWLWGLCSGSILLMVAAWDGIWGRNIIVSMGYAVGMVGLVVLSRILDQSRKAQPPAWLALWGDRSYSLYLAHFPVLMALDYFLERRSPWNAPAVDFILLCTGGMISGWLFYRLIEQPLLVWVRVGHDRLFRRRSPG